MHNTISHRYWNLGYVYQIMLANVNVLIPSRTVYFSPSNPLSLFLLYYSHLDWVCLYIILFSGLITRRSLNVISCRCYKCICFFSSFENTTLSSSLVLSNWKTREFTFMVHLTFVFQSDPSLGRRIYLNHWSRSNKTRHDVYSRYCYYIRQKLTDSVHNSEFVICLLYKP